MTTIRRAFGSIRKRSATPVRYEARYVGPNGERHTIKIKYVSKADASKALAKIQTEISAGTWTSPEAPKKVISETFAPYAAKWLLTRTLKPRTVSLYQGLFDRILVPEFGTIHLSGITVRMVREWMAGRPPTPTQNAHAYALLKSVLSQAVEDGLITVNPCQIKKAGQSPSTKKTQVLDHHQVKQLAEEMGGRYLAMVYASSFLCLRFGELTELRRSDLNGTTLRVHRGVTWVGGESIVGRPKSQAGIRTLAVPGFVRAILAQHILQYAEPGEEGLIFPAVNGGHMHHASLYKVFRRARKVIERADLTWHDLRHTGAVFWAQEGATLKELMDLLGHETPTMALHYQHVASGRMQSLSDRVNATFEER